MSAAADGRAGIAADSTSPLFDRTGMAVAEFASDYQKIRYYTNLVVRNAPAGIREVNLLELQISELIKNAIKHGNKSDPEKKVKVFFSFSDSHAHLIVKDEGDGFAKLDEWNAFFKKRMEYFLARDYLNMTDYITFRTESSDDNDGGNALFAAVEFWNEGIVFTRERNCVAVRRKFRE